MKEKIKIKTIVCCLMMTSMLLGLGACNNEDDVMEIFNREVADSFRRNILSKGGTEHPMTLYKRFRGQEPTIDALLIRNGIKR